MQRSLPLFAAPTNPQRSGVPRTFQPSGVEELFAELGGAVFGEGAYRIHDPAHVSEWTDLAVAAFPQLEGKALCFASDWLGRQFGLSTDPERSSRLAVVLIDVHWDEVVSTNHELDQFHETLLASDPELALALQRYARWRGSGGAIPAPKQCVDFTVPLYVGGADDLANMAINDMEVVWGIGSQLLRQVRGLPEGTPIDIDVV